MSKQYAYFKELPVGCAFHLNGNTYKKQSTRTAVITQPVNYAGKWFYFTPKDLCIVGMHDRLAD